MRHTGSFPLRTDLSFLPSGSPATRYMLVSFTAPEVPRATQRPSISVSFVLDRSGSMGGSKLALARDAVRQALAMLHSDDRFSLVAYDDQVDVVVETVTASTEARRNALTRLEAIGAGTALDDVDAPRRGAGRQWSPSGEAEPDPPLIARRFEAQLHWEPVH